ncbi:MAG: aspartate/glutamate racemase family protein [bacterium]|nr:aspartate/glutamate racemase family protein [bacterium]
MPDQPVARGESAWARVLGIVGGLGPHAHIRFERLLLREAEARALGTVLGDRDYPPFLVSSLPGTPDRTEYVLGRGPSPLPWLERSLRALEAAGGAGDGVGADFAVIACNAAHVVLPELRAAKILPILDLVSETIAHVRGRSAVRTVGLLATTGTLVAGLYQKACAAHGLDAMSLLDLPGGERLQESLVMASIYGTAKQPGIKGGAHRQPEHRDRLQCALERAVALLRDAGGDLVVTACTEIPLVLSPRGPGSPLGVEVVDPLEVAARAAIAVAAGEREAEIDL